MLYVVLKFLHIVAAIVWIGGVITLTGLNMRLAKTGNRETLAALASAATFYGQRAVAPAAAVTLLAGIATAVTAGFRMNNLWIIWGFAAILLSLAIGGFLVGVTTQRLSTLAATPDADPAQIAAQQARLALLNGINILILLSAVWVMVAKPTL